MLFRSIFESLASHKSSFLALPEWRRLLKYQYIVQPVPTLGHSTETAYGPLIYYETLLDEMANIPGLLAAYNEISGSTGTHSSNTLASTANLPCIPEPVTFGTTIIDLKQKVVETLQTIENLASSILFVHSEIPTNEWALKTENNSRSLRARDTHGPLFSTLLWFESFEDRKSVV